jgi:hypothetical protein
MLYVLCGYEIDIRSHLLTPWLLLGEIGIPVVTGFTPRPPQKLSPPFASPLSPAFSLPQARDHNNDCFFVLAVWGLQAPLDRVSFVIWIRMSGH